jgi:hypothetical protein
VRVLNLGMDWEMLDMMCRGLSVLLMLTLSERANIYPISIRAHYAEASFKKDEFE